MGVNLETPIQPSPSQDAAFVAVPTEAEANPRVLLIEGDPSFREAIRDFLMESGYDVVTVETSDEGVGAILRGEFAFVVCDLLMPALPGDAFYRTVELARPDLCPRIIFTTPRQNDRGAFQFIESVHGALLIKPFPMEELLEKMGGPRRSPPVSMPDPEPLPQPAFMPLPRRPTRSFLEPSPGKTDAVRDPKNAGSGINFLTIFAVLLGAVGVWFHAQESRRNLLAAETELASLQTQWTALSTGLQDSEAVRPRLEAKWSRLQRVVDERDLPSWAPVLRGVVMKAGPEIEFRTIRARGIEGRPGACEIRIEGHAVGRSPETHAENFRRMMAASLTENGRANAVVRLDRLELQPPDPRGPSPREWAIFTISATVPETPSTKGSP